jgi:hypothetical protein
MLFFNFDNVLLLSVFMKKAKLTDFPMIYKISLVSSLLKDLKLMMMMMYSSFKCFGVVNEYLVWQVGQQQYVLKVLPNNPIPFSKCTHEYKLLWASLKKAE